MKENDDETLADKTVQSYIGALKKIFVIEDMPAWNPNLRWVVHKPSKKESLR